MSTFAFILKKLYLCAIKEYIKMKTSEFYILREIAGDTLLVPVGEASQRLNGMIHLTETASFIWNHIDTCKNLEEIVEKLQEEYDVDAQTAHQDVFGFAFELFKHQMILDVPEFKDIKFVPAQEKPEK